MQKKAKQKKYNLREAPISPSHKEIKYLGINLIEI